MQVPELLSIPDIVAQTDGNLGVDALGRPIRLLGMLRTLLEERFKLRVRIEPRETALYHLVTATDDGKPGAGMRLSERNCPVYPQGVPRPAPDPVHWCGLQATASGPTVRVVAQSISMDDLATRLQGFRSVGRPVQNRTPLEGRYDFTFEFTTTPKRSDHDRVQESRQLRAVTGAATVRAALRLGSAGWVISRRRGIAAASVPDVQCASPTRDGAG